MKQKTRFCVRLLKVINATCKNPQITKHKSVSKHYADFNRVFQKGFYCALSSSWLQTLLNFRPTSAFQMTKRPLTDRYKIEYSCCCFLVVLGNNNNCTRFCIDLFMVSLSSQARSSHRFEGSNEPPFVRQVSFFFLVRLRARLVLSSHDVSAAQTKHLSRFESLRPRKSQQAVRSKKNNALEVNLWLHPILFPGSTSGAYLQEEVRARASQIPTSSHIWRTETELSTGAWPSRSAFWMAASDKSWKNGWTSTNGLHTPQRRTEVKKKKVSVYHALCFTEVVVKTPVLGSWSRSLWPTGQELQQPWRPWERRCQQNAQREC